MSRRGKEGLDATGALRAADEEGHVLHMPQAPDRGRELRNLAEVGRALAFAAYVREETRGWHTAHGLGGAPEAP